MLEIVFQVISSKMLKIYNFHVEISSLHEYGIKLFLKLTTVTKRALLTRICLVIHCERIALKVLFVKVCFLYFSAMFTRRLPHETSKFTGKVFTSSKKRKGNKTIQSKFSNIGP